jgi:hypothetical protein
MIDTATYLGPATALRNAVGDHVEVSFPTGEQVRARLALAVPFRPSAGDELLVAAQDPDTAYVIGVLRSRGPMKLAAAGDIVIESRGTLSMSAARVKLTGGVLEIVAGRLLQRARAAYAWIAGLFQLKTQRTRMSAESTWHLDSGRAVLRAKNDVRVNGKTINLN